MSQLSQQPQQQVRSTGQQTGGPRYQQGGGTTGRYGAKGATGGQQFGGGISGGQQTTSQPGGMSGQQTTSRPGGISAHFEDAMTSEMRQALADFSEVDKACEWAVDQSLGRGMPEVVRVLRDVADLAEVNEKLLVRSSTVGPYAAVAFVEAATSSLQDLQQHPEPHVVETVNVISRAIDTTHKLLASIGWSGQQIGQQGGQQIGQQGGQQIGQQGGQQIGQQGGQQFGQQGGQQVGKRGGQQSGQYGGQQMGKQGGQQFGRKGGQQIGQQGGQQSAQYGGQ